MRLQLEAPPHFFLVMLAIALLTKFIFASIVSRAVAVKFILNCFDTYFLNKLLIVEKFFRAFIAKQFIYIKTKNLFKLIVYDGNYVIMV